MVDATQIVNYNNNKNGLLHIIRIALSQRLIYRFESCPDYESQEPLRVSTLVDSLERQAI